MYYTYIHTYKHKKVSVSYRHYMKDTDGDEAYKTIHKPIGADDIDHEHEHDKDDDSVDEDEKYYTEMALASAGLAINENSTHRYNTLTGQHTTTKHNDRLNSMKNNTAMKNNFNGIDMGVMRTNQDFKLNNKAYGALKNANSKMQSQRYIINFYVISLLKESQFQKPPQTFDTKSIISTPNTF